MFISNLKKFAQFQPVNKLYSSIILKSYNSNISIVKEDKGQLLISITNYERECLMLVPTG